MPQPRDAQGKTANFAVDTRCDGMDQRGLVRRRRKKAPRRSNLPNDMLFSRVVPVIYFNATETVLNEPFSQCSFNF